MNILQKILFASAVALFLVSMALFFEHRGFDTGYIIAQSKCISEREILTSIPFGPRTYEFFSLRYFHLMIIGSILIGMHFLEKKLGNITVTWRYLIRAASFGVLILALRECYEIFAVKRTLIDEGQLYEPFGVLLLSSIPFDWVCLILLIGLFALEGSKFLNSSRDVGKPR